MALINLPVIQPTQEQIDENTVRKLIYDSEISLITLAKKHKELFEIFWKRPQEYCNIMGTNSVMFFSESRRTQTYLYEALGEAKFAPFMCSIPIDKIVTENEDGTVIITDIPSEE